MKQEEKTTYTLILAVMFFLLPALALFGQNAPDIEEQGSVDRTGRAGETVEITVENQRLDFYPAEIIVTKGTTVRLTFVNTGGNHDWDLDVFDVDTPVISAGEESTVEFVAEEAGEFEYYCSVPGHRAAGMWGYFIVEE